MNQVLLITGGSRGIGAATARLAARRGWAVAVNYASQAAAADEVVRAITAEGGRAIAVQGDVGDEAQVLAMFAQVDVELGPLTGLVNNAGVVDMQVRVDEITVPRLERMLRINVIGSFLCAREAIGRMSRSSGGEGGAIVNLSSLAARTGSPKEYVDYAASKGAIDSFTRGLAAEVAEQDIRVNAVRPGFIHTDMHASGGEPDRIERVKAFVPLKRGGRPEEVAQAILWLLSEEASYTTGAFINVAGGR